MERSEIGEFFMSYPPVFFWGGGVLDGWVFIPIREKMLGKRRERERARRRC